MKRLRKRIANAELQASASQWPRRVAVLVALLLGNLRSHAQATFLPAPGRTPVPRLDYQSWRFAEGEEFDKDGDSTLLAPRWRFDYPWGRNLGGFLTEYYTGQEVRLRGGSLRLTAHRLSPPRRYIAGAETRTLYYTSGMLYRSRNAPDSLRPVGCAPDDGFGYGLFEARCRLPASVAFNPAFWLFGNPDEVDVFEASSTGFSNNVHLHAHAYWRPGPVEESECPCNYYWPAAAAFTEQYHRYAVAWLPDGLTFYFDGVPIRRETRFRPLGCTLTPIVNLSVWAWAVAEKDSLVVDYLRVYRPRQAPPLRFGTEAERLPTPGTLQMPRAVQPERSNPPGQQRWRLQRTGLADLTLALTDNFNPACGTTLPLPTGPVWCPPWVVGLAAPPPAVTVADTATLHWNISDAQGRCAAAGHVPAPALGAMAASWLLPVAVLPPGAYRVRLLLDGAVRYQPLYVIGRPAAPTATTSTEALPSGR